MRTRVVIQSRLSSSRLPGKALMTVGGMPLIELVARRASRTGFEVVVATSVESYDDRIAAQLEPIGIRVIRGPLDDVLARFLTATSDMDETDRVVRLTGDNPVADADLVQEVIDAMEASGSGYGRVDIEQVPEGLGVEVFDVATLRRAGREAADSYDREHVTPWIRRNTKELLFAPKRNPGQPAVFRATVDCLHDFVRVSRLFDGFADPVTVSWSDIMQSLVGQVTALGPIAREVPKLKRRLTTILLGVTNVGWSVDEPRDGWTIREVFTRAVEAGVSDVICKADQAGFVATGLLPMLKQRMGVSVVLPAVAEAASPETELRYLLERVRGDSGHAALRTVLLQESDLLSEHPSELIGVLEEYRGRKAISEFGVLLSATGELEPDAVPMLTAAAIDLEQGGNERAEQWQAPERIVIGIARQATTRDVRQALESGALDTVCVQPHNRRELTSLLAAG